MASPPRSAIKGKFGAGRRVGMFSLGGRVAVPFTIPITVMTILPSEFFFLIYFQESEDDVKKKLKEH
jgi:hypothetical protein